MPVVTYDPSQVIVSINASGLSSNLSGFADGTFISVERAVETFSKVVGAGGEVARVKSADRSGTLTLTLMQTSNSNLILNALADADEQSGAGLFSIQIKDLTTGGDIQATEAWIKGKPKVEFGKDLSNREWVFEFASVSINPGGV